MPTRYFSDGGAAPQSWYRDLRYQSTLSITPGDPVVLILPPVARQASVAAFPGGGGSLLVEYSLSSEAAVVGGTGRWLPWPSGTVTTGTADTLISQAMALRITATTAAGVVEVLI